MLSTYTMAMRYMLLAAVVLATVARAWQKGGADRLDSQLFVRNKYIVEVSGDSNALSKRGLTPDKALERVVNDVKAQGSEWKVNMRFSARPQAFNGLSITVPEGTPVEDLENMDGVEAVWPIRKIHISAPPKEADEPDDDEATTGEAVTARELLDNPDERDKPFAADQPRKRSDQFEQHAKRTSHLRSRAVPASAYRNNVFGPHVQTSIDRVHERELIGAGVKVCFLDDGVDYLNPILGGCYGPGCQITGGYDFTGDNYDGDNEPQPDNDPYATCQSHGTAVAGIMAALPNPYGFTGVSPGATYNAYRVYGCTGVLTEDMVLAGLQRASTDNCQVISLSLGIPIGWLSASPAQRLVDRLSRIEGRHVLNANGNEGTEGAFFTVSPAASVENSAVGSAELAYLPTYQMNIRGRSPIAYMAPKPLSVSVTGEYQIYFTSLDSTVTNDACSTLPTSTPDLSTRVTVVRRGTCSFDVKYRNVVAAGGRIVLVYNTNDFMLPQLNVGSSGLAAVAGLTREAGETLLNAYKAITRGFLVSFPSGPLSPAGPNALLGTVETSRGGVMSPFSNTGPTYDMAGFPSYVGPGSNILTTVPMSSGGVAIFRGTSYSCPLAAGATALLISARASERLTPANVRGLLTTTASFVPTIVNGSTPATLLQAGGGMINVFKALNARSLINPSGWNLNDTATRTITRRLQIRNTNTYTIRYSLGHIAAQTRGVYTNSASSDVLPATTPSVITDSGATVTFSRNDFDTLPGQSFDLLVSWQRPAHSAADIARFPLYSGFVTVTGRGTDGSVIPSETYTVPYNGLNARLFDMPVLDTTGRIIGPQFPFLAVGEDINVGSGTYQRDGSLAIYFRLVAGTRRLTLDLVDADIDFTGTIPPVTNMRRFRRSDWPERRSTSAWQSDAASSLERRAYTTFAEVPTLGSILSSTLVPRDPRVTPGAPPFTELPFDGTYTRADGTTAQAALNTQYRVLLRALKITGDLVNQDQYESWLSPPFSFNA